MDTNDMSRLLDELLALSGYSFISDLHIPEYAERVRDAALRINAEKYSADSWNGVIRYITLCDDRFESSSEARSFLISKLSE